MQLNVVLIIVDIKIYKKSQILEHQLFSKLVKYRKEDITVEGGATERERRKRERRKGEAGERSVSLNDHEIWGRKSDIKEERNKRVGGSFRQI